MSKRQERKFRAILVAELEECNALHTMAEQTGGPAQYFLGRIASLTRTLYLLDSIGRMVAP